MSTEKRSFTSKHKAQFLVLSAQAINSRHKTVLFVPKEVSSDKYIDKRKAKKRAKQNLKFSYA